MQFQSPKKNRPFSFRSLAALAAFGALAMAACDDKSSPTADPDADKLISLSRPLGGETFKVGDSLHVNWTVKTTSSGTIDAVDVLISPDSGKTWIHIPWGPNQLTGSVNPASYYWTHFAWKVTDSLYVAEKDANMRISGKQCLIRAKDYTTNADLNQSTTHSSITINP